VPATLGADQWALGGTWTVSSEEAVLQQPHGKIVYRFNGRDLHLVLGPATDGRGVHFRVRLDGADPGANKGADIESDGSGVVTEQRLYQLIRLAQPGAEHTVESTSGIRASRPCVYVRLRSAVRSCTTEDHGWGRYWRSVALDYWPERARARRQRRSRSPS